MLLQVSAAISENIQANTIEGVLRGTKAKIEARARGIVEGKPILHYTSYFPVQIPETTKGSVAIEDREEHHKAEIAKNSKRVVDSSNGFSTKNCHD